LKLQWSATKASLASSDLEKQNDSLRGRGPTETDAYRIKAEDFQEEFDEGEALHELILRYLNVLLADLAVSSVPSFSHC